MSATPFSAELVVDEQTAIREQREVNAGTRATFAAVNSTLRSQGAAIRGMEELLKRALPEIDRLTKAERTKASLEQVELIAADLSRQRESLSTLGEAKRELAVTLERKLDGNIGRQALDALSRQQSQVEQEAAAREAVTAEVVRLAASIAAFATTLEAVRGEGKTREHRIVTLERRCDGTDAQITSDREEVARQLNIKVRSQWPEPADEARG